MTHRKYRNPFRDFMRSTHFIVILRYYLPVFTVMTFAVIFRNQRWMKLLVRESRLCHQIVLAIVFFTTRYPLKKTSVSIKNVL